MPTRVTMQHIADHVGVSKFAVSKALSGQPGVSPETRERIVRAAAQLGYFANAARKLPAARGASQAGGRPGLRRMVVVLIPNVRYQDRKSAYWGRIVDGISEALERHRLGMTIVSEPAAGSFSGHVNPDTVLGLIGVGHIANPLLLEVRGKGIPFVLIDHEDPLIPADTLFMDNYECERRMTRYLLSNGHRRLQFVGPVGFARSFRDRWNGYRSMLEEHGIPLAQDERLLAVEGVNRSELTEALEPIVRSLADDGALPSAFVCANDSIAICVMTILLKFGIGVPERVSVAGFDNIDDAALSRPSLSTVHVNKEALGRRAVDALLNRIEQPNEPKEKILLSGDILLRQSTAPAAD